jgi:hypothetical protein
MKIKFLLFFVLLLGFHCLIHSELPEVQPDERTPIDSTFHEALKIGLDCVARNHYVKGLAIFDSMQQNFPNHPAPNFYKAATYQSWMLTYRINKFQSDLYENAKLSIDKGTRLLQKDDDPWLNFYVGAAYGYIALHRFRQHNWIGAYLDGRKGIKNFNTALKKLPSLYDCYYGLGSYNYWRTAKSKFLRFVVFWMRDKRELGLDQLRISIDHGRYCPFDATHGLMIAYYHHGDYDRALALNNTAMKLIDPPSLGTLYMRGRLMVTFENWAAVQDIFEKILGQLMAYSHQSISYQVECKYWIALALRNQNQTDEAYELVLSSLAQSENWVKDRELENPFEGFDVIKKHLEKLYDILEKERAE